jgi:hypothetical protein
MKFTILSDDKTPIERTLKIRVESEFIEQIWRQEVLRLAKETTLPGFRPGRAPPHLVERHIGRVEIWKYVRNIVARDVTQLLLKGAQPEPLTPPKIDFNGQGKGEEQKSKDVWTWGDRLEFTVNYFLTPPSPEDIERDLLSREGGELPETPLREFEDLCQPHGLPPDPRAQIPGSGAHIGRPHPHPNPCNINPNPKPDDEPL